jgi:seryl-tRNA synthetase
MVETYHYIDLEAARLRTAREMERLQTQRETLLRKIAHVDYQIHMHEESYMRLSTEVHRVKRARENDEAQERQKKQEVE